MSEQDEKKYRCIEPFYVEDFDGNGFLIEEGSIWGKTEDNYIGGDIHLELEKYTATFS